MSIRREENFNKKGERHGSFKEYYVRLDGTEQLVTDGSYINGKKNGEWKSYSIGGNENRNPESISNFKNGKKHGSFIMYGPQGKAYYEKEFHNDKLMLHKHYILDDDGSYLSSVTTRIGRNRLKMILYHEYAKLIRSEFITDDVYRIIDYRYDHYMCAGKIVYITKTRFKNGRTKGDIILVDENYNELECKGFGVLGCIWNVKYYEGLLHIGCKSKTIAEWDEWFAGTEEYSHHRHTQEFKEIHETYLKARKKAISFEKKLAQLK